MLPWVGLAITMLASPVDGGGTRRVSERVLSSALEVSSQPERTTDGRLERWVSSLAVVRPGSSATASSSILLFVAIAPVGGAVGLRAVGTF